MTNKPRKTFCVTVFYDGGRDQIDVFADNEFEAAREAKQKTGDSEARVLSVKEYTFRL